MRIIKRLAQRTIENWEPFDSENFFLKKKGSLRSRYLRARNDIIRSGFNIVKDSNISAFVKLERYFDETKSPRMIMGRNPKFNILYAQLIEPLEKAFFKLDEVANGKDHHGVGQQFSKMASRCSHFKENDMSKYESSQRMQVLQLEYLFYSTVIKAVCPEMLPLLHIAYAACLQSKVQTNLGVYLEFILCRVSGDLTTSLGNGIINLITSIFNQVMNTCDPQRCNLDLCEYPGCRARDVIVKGDDSVLGANPNTNFHDYYSWFGLDAKIIDRRNAETVEFCSGNFIEVTPGNWVYVQKLQKLLESLTTCLNESAIRNGWVAQYYYSLGVMYKIVYKNIPVYEDVADFLLRTNITKQTRANIDLVTSYNLKDAYSSKHEEFVVDKSSAYLGVSIANGMDYAELERITNWCKNNSLHFPTNMLKRCRSNNKRLDQDCSFNFQYLNAQVLKSHLTPKYKKDISVLKRLDNIFEACTQGLY